MPTLLAMVIASLAGSLVQGPLRAILGPISSTALSLLVSAVAFFFAKQFLKDLRDGA